MELAAFVVSNAFMVGVFVWLFKRTEDAHRADRQALITAALNASGTPYYPTVAPRVGEPKAKEPRLFTEDGMDELVGAA